MKDKNIVYKKLDQDDILEIVVEHFYDELKDYPLARAELFGKPGEDLRVVIAYGKEHGEEIRDLDFREIDSNMDYNGDHAFIKELQNKDQ